MERLASSVSLAVLSTRGRVHAAALRGPLTPCRRDGSIEKKEADAAAELDKAAQHYIDAEVSWQQFRAMATTKAAVPQ